MTNNNARTTFYYNLNFWMRIRRVTQTDIANDLDIPFTTISNWYSGKSYPKVENMQRLANYLNISVGDLVE